jgi:hypothetical protein
VGVSFVAGAILAVIKGTVEVPKDYTVVCIPLVAYFVDIVPEVIWAILGWGVDGE